MKLTRRTMMATGAAALAAPSVLRAQSSFSLKASTYLPPQHQISTELVRWADELREMTSGALDIEVFPAGQMGPPPRQYDLARTGVADIAFMYTAFTPGRFPRTDVMALPFAMENAEGAPISSADASWLATSLKDQFAEDYVGTELLYDVTLVQTGFFMRDLLVREPSDINGLRLRPTTSLVAEQLETFGASPATVGPAELADAINKGVVDGAIFNFEGGVVFQLQQAVRHVSLMPNAAATFSTVMNSDALAGLPADLQGAIRETTGSEAARRIGGLYDDAEARGRAVFEEDGVEVIELFGAAADPFREAAAPIAEEQRAALTDAGVDVDGILAQIERLKTEL